jgi:Flp pilus assembly protein TadD
MAWLVPAFFVTLAGCRPADQRTDSVDPQAGLLDRAEMTPEVVAQLDSGSQAFRNDDFELALRHYTSVTEMAPDVGAGWFGVYMAHQELGNEDEARAALERARSLVPGATLIHADSGG